MQDNGDEDAAMVVCLFCDAAFGGAEEVLAHANAEHGWDIAAHLYQAKDPDSGAPYSFYDRMKILNYIRKTVPPPPIIYSQSERGL